MSGGSSSTGESGVTGNVGLTGPRGEIGFCCPGTRGATGFTGQFGVQGPELTGPQGNIGPCCNTLTGPAGMSGPNGVYCVGCTTPIFVGNTVYVDAVFGNDTTGQRERFDLPFATLAGASGVTQAGDLIIVRPGTYTPSAQLPNIGFNWYFEEGAIVINASTSIFGPGSYDISGFGYLNVILTRDNGNVTANYVQRLNVNTTNPAYVVTVNVKLMNRIVVTAGELQGTVNELSSAAVTTPLFTNTSGIVQLTIDNFSYPTSGRSSTNTQLFNIHAETELTINNLTILDTHTQTISELFALNSGTLNLFFDQITIMPSTENGSVNSLFNFNAGIANIKGNLILDNNTTPTAIDVFLIIGSPTVTVDVNTISVYGGSILGRFMAENAGNITIRGNSHLISTGTQGSSSYIYKLNSLATVLIDVKNINSDGSIGMMSSGVMDIKAESITSEGDYLYNVTGGTLYSRVETSISAGNIYTDTSSGGPSQIVLHGGYQVTADGSPVLQIDTTMGEELPTIVLRGCTLQTVGTTSSITTIGSIVIQNHGAVTANNPVGSDVEFLFKPTMSPQFNGYNVKSYVTI